jgi:hypothetical protein
MQASERPVVEIRAARLRHHAGLIGLKTDYALAAHLKVPQSTVMRLMSGESRPGELLIASVLTAFPELGFDDLFEVVAPEGSAA